MRKTTVYLPDDIRRGLEDAARETGRSQAELIRDALRTYLTGRPAPWPESIGRHRSGGGFAARDDEKILAERWR
ncbi:MAG: CopG family transcriptional regulator [Solirubrobacteraceae bacterium]